MKSLRITLAILLGIAFSASLASAGGPLLCQPYEISAAKSLPSGTDGHGINAKYDRKNLIAETLAVLTPETPTLVRMETLRRAALYATIGRIQAPRYNITADDEKVSASLIAALGSRVDSASEKSRASALFDLGFCASLLRALESGTKVDGYELISQAIKIRGGDPEMEFALALVSHHPRRAEFESHLAKARAGAKPKSLLAVNLDSHLPKS